MTAVSERLGVWNGEKFPQLRPDGPASVVSPALLFIDAQFSTAENPSGPQARVKHPQRPARPFCFVPPEIEWP
jgi:hypothetical protein